MEKQITTEQIEKAKELAKDFRAENGKEFYVYNGEISAFNYCYLIGIDYVTVHLLGEVGYKITYYETEDKKYQLACETYIDNVSNDKLSFTLESTEDYLGFFTKAEIDETQELPSNWKELMSDEQKEEIAREWCEENSVLDFLSDSEKEEVADEYIENNNSDVLDEAYSCLSSYEQREFIKDCIDEL